jgi:hypothetical protein
LGLHYEQHAIVEIPKGTILMRLSALAVGLLAALAAAPANATVLFSTVHTPATVNGTRLNLPNTGSTGALPRGGPIGESFNVPTDTTITSVSLQLTALDNSDGASVLIYLVPNTGGATGIAGSPTFTGAGSTLALTGAIQIGSMLDSALVTTPAGALETFNTNVPVTAGEYWLVAENTVGTGGVAGTAKWVFDSTAYNDGIAITGQDIFWQAGGGANITSTCTTPGVPCTFLDTTYLSNLYIAAVDAPEPLSVAILGAGLAGLGIVRRGRRHD